VRRRLPPAGTCGLIEGGGAVGIAKWRRIGCDTGVSWLAGVCWAWQAPKVAKKKNTVSLSPPNTDEIFEKHTEKNKMCFFVNQ